MADRQGKKSWWTTLPGVITAIAGLVTAVTGLLVALHQTGLLAGEEATTAPPPPSQIAGPGPLDNKTFTVDGNNLIRISQTSLGKQQIGFALEVASNITWWKQILVFDKNGTPLATLETINDSKGPISSGAFDTSRFGDRITVELWKAKFAGTTTRVATKSYAVGEMLGYRTKFYWENDS